MWGVERNAHVRTMRMLRQKYNDMNDDESQSWLSHILSRDIDSQPIQLRSKKYDIELLLERGFSRLDFLTEGMSWDRMVSLGYCLEESKRLGFTTDDLCSCGIKNSHLVAERKFVLAEKRKGLVERVCCSKIDVLAWSPSELFRLGFTRAELMTNFGFTSDELHDTGLVQYFGGEVRAATGGFGERIAGPRSGQSIPDLRIDMSRLM